MNEPTQATAGVAPVPFSILDRWFRPVRVPLEAQRELSELARRGTIVFVMRSAGLLSLLYLAWLTRQLRLPPVRVALGLGRGAAWVARVSRGSLALRDAIRTRESAVVFLQGVSGEDPFPLLASLQRSSQYPVFLVPALLLWARRPQKVKPTVGEMLLGTPDVPSPLANFLGFVVNHRRAVLRLGHASDLLDFVRGRATSSDAVLGRMARGSLHLHLARETRAAVGPPMRSPARTRERVLRDRTLRRALEEEARATGKPLSALEAEAARDLREIESRYSPGFIELVRPLLAWLFGRLYEAVDVDQEGLARVKRAVSETPIVLCPSHKSHIDYLVLSWIFYEHGMPPPHIAAGINLSFWPFGPIARWGGAFFIRRSLRGDRVYTAALRAYVKQLLRDRFPQEFYLEGGRSRSGKLLFPKTGLFSMEVDAWLEHPDGDVLFVPVSIDYERLVEGAGYARELAGGDKAKESFRGLLRAGKVLGRRYGRLTVQFQPPVSLRDFAAARPGGAEALAEGSADGAAAKKALVQALANRVAGGINDAITMTPVGLLAASLLAHERRGLAADELARRVELLRSLALEESARFARGAATASTDPRSEGPFADAMTRLVDDGLVRVERAAGETIYQVVDDRRPLLDYHKNAVLHRYVPVALAAAALRACGSEASVGSVAERARWLSRLLKLEFTYRVGAPFEALFAESVARLERLRAVRRDEDRLAAGVDRPNLEFLGALLRPYLEAYRLAAATLMEASAPGRPPLDRRALVKAALERGRADHAAGRIALRESVSRATLENAFEWLLQQGATPSEDGPPTLHEPWRTETLPLLAADLNHQLSSS